MTKKGLALAPPETRTRVGRLGRGAQARHGTAFQWSREQARAARALQKARGQTNTSGLRRGTPAGETRPELPRAPARIKRPRESVGLLCSVCNRPSEARNGRCRFHPQE